jgi:hypothetical protein
LNRDNLPPTVGTSRTRGSEQIGERMNQRSAGSSLNHMTLCRTATTALTLAVFLALSGCGGPAQIGSDEEALKAVDALYTAVSTRRIELLDDCAARIDELHSKKKLPDAAFHQLKPLIAEARAGEWKTALRKLYDFMRGQRGRTH